jgi:two-component system, NarL family, sensor histidine kinase UhpB
MVTLATSPVALRGSRIGALTLIFGLACALAVGAPSARTPIELITQARAIVSNDPAIPHLASQTPTSLPDDWSVTRPLTNDSVWYHASFETRAPADTNEWLALYIERVCGNVDVHLNGQRIFSSGSTQEPVTRNCAYPQLIALPTALLREDGNALDLRVHGHALRRVAAVQRAGGLSELKIGPRALLAAEHDRELFWRVTVVQIATAVLGVLGCVMLVLGWPGRREGHEWALGWLLLGWALLSLRLWLRNPALDNAIVEFIATAGQALLAALAVLFLLRYARWAFRPLKVALLVQCLLVPMSILLAGPNRLHLMSALWSVVLALEMFAAMGLYLALAWPQRGADFWAMAPVLACAAGLLLMELAFQRHLLAVPAVDITQLGLSLALIALGARVLVQFSGASQARLIEAADKKLLETRLNELTVEHERALAELAALHAEAQKAQQHKRAAMVLPDFAAETERNLAHRAELHVEQATAQERKRIAADLHDDLGAKLLTIVHTSESDRISALAREALEEMRLSVRGLSGKPMRLADALADWRAETVARLSQANIEIDWRGPTEETEQRLAARSFVQTTRILREAISNIIKHSGASQCKVRCGIREREFGLVVQDNGNGISMQLDGKLDRGHGMASMKNRAKQMQGQCLVESGPGYGTVIRLTLPL